MRKNKTAGNAPEKQIKRVAIYIRVSTNYQVDKDSLPMQRKDLIAYSELILGIPDYEIFEDAGYSGKNTDRPAFQNMMAKVRRHEFSHVLVWKIDRISRNLLDFSEMYEELQALRVTFVSKNEQFDTSTAMGGAMLKIILVFAELERNMTSERVTATMISRASQGQWNGGRVPYGYDYDPETSAFSIREDEAAVCRILKDDYLKHRSLVHTSRLLNEKGFITRSGAKWSPTTVWIIASSPFYAGIYRYNHYKGTENRTENPPDEWVLVPEHHPAIFTVQEYEAMAAIRSDNDRQKNSPGKQCRRLHTYVFGGLCYCGKCGSKLLSTPGRVQADGYRTAIYSCPNRRKTNDCDNPSMNDLQMGEFVLNYVLNMLNAKRSFSTIRTPAELETRLLTGSNFSGVEHIAEAGLNDFYNLLSRYGSDSSYVFAVKKPRRKKAAPDPELDALRREKERQERAMQRLQDLYLYSESSMPEKDFIIRKSEISARLAEVQQKLGMLSRDADSVLSDEEFVRQASHLLITSRLNTKEYIYYKTFAQSVSPEILQSYMQSIIDNIQTVDGHVSRIVFKNGLTHQFIWK